MSTGWAGWLTERHVEETSAQRLSRQGWQDRARQERAEEAAELAQAAEAEEAHDRRLMRFRQAGIVARPAGDVFAQAAAIGDEDQEFEAARATMERITRRRERRAAVAQDQMAAMQRAEVPGDVDLLAGAKQLHRAFREETRRQLAEAATGAPRARRPKELSRSRGGEAVRSELECWYCRQGNVSHEDSTLLHLDPAYAVPITSEAQAKAAEQAEHAERRTPGRRYAEISR
jgi:hypothetical protein